MLHLILKIKAYNYTASPCGLGSELAEGTAVNAYLCYQLLAETSCISLHGDKPFSNPLPNPVRLDTLYIP